MPVVSNSDWVINTPTREVSYEVPTVIPSVANDIVPIYGARRAATDKFDEDDEPPILM